MAEFTLRKAAELVGKSKSTIFRAIKTGRLSATKTDTGDFAIQAAELFRVYKPLKGAGGGSGTAQRVTQRFMGHDATANATAETTVETAVRMAELETELRVLRELLDELKRQRDDYKTERDSWRDRAEHLLTFDRPKKEQAPQEDVIRAESMADIISRMKTDRHKRQRKFMQETDKPLPPAATAEEIVDYETRLRKLVEKRAKHDADFAALKENLDERLPKITG